MKPRASQPAGRRIKQAAPSAEVLAYRLDKGKYRYDAEGGLEKRCNRCHDFWPADSEFFYPGKGLDGLIDRCKACSQEIARKADRATTVSPAPPHFSVADFGKILGAGTCT